MLLDRKTKRLGIAFSIAALLHACGGQPERVPRELLQPEEMTRVMQDLFIAHGIAENFPVRQKAARDSLYMLRYRAVLNKHRITQKYWLESLDFYTRHPKFLAEVNEQVLTRLKQRQTEMRHAYKEEGE
jgi:predicted DNA-binding transcriptional regulator